MRYLYILLTLVLFLTQCSSKQDSKKESVIEAYIGNVKMSKFSSTEFFHIYVSIMIINNTDRDFFIQPKHAHIEKSDFKGIIGQDTIPFDIQMLPTCISSHDTLIGHLAHMFYDPKMIDSLFLDKIKCMNLIYSLPKNTVKGENGMQYLSFEKHDSSKFIILRDNVGIEGAFIFGIYEFKPYLADTTFMSYDKSLVTGEYIYDLCHKMLED